MNRVASGPGSSTGTISVPVAPMSGPASPAVGYGNPASSPFMDVGAKHVPLRQPVPSSVSPTPWQATIHHIGDIDNDDDDQKVNAAEMTAATGIAAAAAIMILQAHIASRMLEHL